MASRLLPKVVANYLKVIRPFTGRIAKIAGITFVYQVFNLLNSTAVGALAFIIDRNLGFSWLIGHAIVSMLYEEVFIAFDNFLDLMIVQLLHDVYEYLQDSSKRVYAYIDEYWHKDHNSVQTFEEIGRSTDKVMLITEGVCWEFIPTSENGLLSTLVLGLVSLPALLLMIPAVFLYTLITLKQERKQLPKREERYRSFKKAGKISSFLKAHYTVAAFGQQEFILKKFAEVQREIARMGQELAMNDIRIYGRRKMRTMAVSARSTLLILGMNVTFAGLPFPILLAVWELVSRLSSSVNRLVRVYTKLLEYQVEIEEFGKFLKLEPQIKSPENPVEIPDGSVGISFRNVTLSYNGDGKLALKSVSFDIAPGEVIGIVGLSGAGKSSIVSLMNRIYDVTEGQVLVNGVNVKDADLTQLRRLYAIVSQGVDVFDDSLLNNIRFSEPNCTMEEVWRAVERSGLNEDGFIDDLPYGLDTQIGEEGIKLSGGQVQRLGIARALVMDAKVLLFDEATSSQDAIKVRKLQRELINLIKESGKTAVVIAHNLDTLRGMVGRILVMKEGEIVEEGTHEQLLATRGLYEKLWNAHRMELDELSELAR